MKGISRGFFFVILLILMVLILTLTFLIIKNFGKIFLG
jgi:uncharacterized protein (UPF0333 family)